MMQDLGESKTNLDELIEPQRDTCPDYSLEREDEEEEKHEPA